MTLTNQATWRQRLSAGDKLKMPPGWRGPISYGAAKPVNGEKRVRAIMECKDYDPQLLRDGTRKFIIRRVERTAPNKMLALASMEEFIAELDRRFPGGNAKAEHRSITVAEAVEKYMNLQVRGVRRARTVSSYEVSAKPVIAKLGSIGLDDLDAAEIKSALFEAQRTRSHKRIDILSRAIECARENNEFAKDKANPCKAVPDVFEAALDEDAEAALPKVERGEIPDAEITKLFEVVKNNPKWLAMFYLAAFAGPRCGELLNMRRDGYNAERGTQMVGRSKTQSSSFREIVLGQTGKMLIEKLLAHHEARGYEGPWLFPAELGGKYTHTNFSKAFKPLMFAAGLATKSKGENGQRARYDDSRTRVAGRTYIEPKWTMHDFRHTVSIRDRDIVPPIYLDAQVGHKNAQRALDRNAIENPYTRSQGRSESFFEARQRFARLVDERATKLLPTDDGSAEDKARKAWGMGDAA